jgi:hypothetical protein
MTVAHQVISTSQRFKRTQPSQQSDASGTPMAFKVRSRPPKGLSDAVRLTDGFGKKASKVAYRLPPVGILVIARRRPSAVNEDDDFSHCSRSQLS